MAIVQISLPAVERPEVEIESEEGGGERWVVPGRSIPGKTISIEQGLLGNLTLLARNAAEKAYAPYSKFRVGAAVVMADDPAESVFTGCNIENASYGATVCAERSAIHAAVSAGFRRISILALSVADALEAPLAGRSPCGICRQVIREFSDERTLIVIDSGDPGTIGEVLDVERLLPHGFSLDQPE